MSYSVQNAKPLRRKSGEKISTVWMAAKQRVAEGRLPVRIPPHGDLGSPYPHQAIEKRRAKYSDSELKSAAEMFARLKRGDDARMEKVQSVRESVEREDYENEIKMEIAIDRLLEQLVE